jgi:hypothetical protein
MRLPKILLVIFSITVISLFYVHQQTEVFRLAYIGQKKAVLFHELLDKNNCLRYNIEKSASLVRLGNKVISEKDFQMPDSYRLVSLETTGRGFTQTALSKEEGLILRIFSVKTEAEAKTIGR